MRQRLRRVVDASRATKGRYTLPVLTGRATAR